MFTNNVHLSFLFYIIIVSATAFYKEQSALIFLCEVISPGGRGGGRYGGGGWSSYRGGSGQYGRGGYSGRGGGDYGRCDGDTRPEPVVPNCLHDHERVTFAEEIKG